MVTFLVLLPSDKAGLAKKSASVFTALSWITTKAVNYLPYLGDRHRDVPNIPVRNPAFT